MQFSEAWLRSLVNPELSAEQLGHRLTMAGLEVEALEPVAPAFDRVVVAEIISAERHPDADRLQLCRVDVGSGEPLQIVCGAPNARPGLKTACALVGARLPAMEIKRAKVRGVESFGMLCSAKELGIDPDAAGILELPAEAPSGTDLRDFLGLDDRLFTLKLTPNRGDCLSVLGIAREVAALTGATLQAPDATPVAAQSADRQAVVVEAGAACPRYCGRVIRGIDPTAQTPEWMRRRLIRSGLRVIHPVVDVTNYVLLELGEPMHAFDLAQLQGDIRVRLAMPGERLELLNEEHIDLEADCLVIADDSGPLALAGIMGGATSGVTADTRDIFLEAAHFSPAAIAGRARRFGFATDSSHRFERGVDPQLPLHAMERATRLILDVCGGQAGEIVAAGPGIAPRPPVAFRPERARRVLGMDIADDEVRRLFDGLGLQAAGTGESWQVACPPHRFDLNIEVDLIEEVARLKGYEHIPAARPRVASALLPAGEGSRPEAEVKAALVARGYQEIITYSFISAEQHLDFTGHESEFPLLNPIASHLDVMRGNLLAGLVLTLRHNLNHGQERLRLFEQGRCFEGVEADRQPVRLAGLAYGPAHPEQWGETARLVDFYDLKGDLEALLWPARAEFRAVVHPALHPGQCAAVYLQGSPIGWVGSLHPKLVQKYAFPRVPVLFELDAAALETRVVPGYERVPRMPAVRRDLSVLVDAGLPVGELLSTVRAALPEHVSEFELFDLYQGQGVSEDKKSLAFRMLLQHTEKTLTEAEIEATVAEVLAVLTRSFNATLRA